jgi:hypothetical protein
LKKFINPAEDQMTTSTFTEKQLKNFARYVVLQSSGKYNMLDPKAVGASGLTINEYLFVLGNYDALSVAYKTWKEPK